MGTYNFSERLDEIKAQLSPADLAKVEVARKFLQSRTVPLEQQDYLICFYAAIHLNLEYNKDDTKPLIKGEILSDLYNANPELFLKADTLIIELVSKIDRSSIEVQETLDAILCTPAPKNPPEVVEIEAPSAITKRLKPDRSIDRPKPLRSPNPSRVFENREKEQTPPPFKMEITPEDELMRPVITALTVLVLKGELCNLRAQLLLSACNAALQNGGDLEKAVGMINPALTREANGHVVPHIMEAFQGVNEWLVQREGRFPDRFKVPSGWSHKSTRAPS